MKKFFKNNLKTILVAGATAIICISGTAFATGYLAKDIGYVREGTNIKNVQDALNDLYSVSQKKIIKVIIGSNNSSSDRTFDITQIPNYQNLTIDNFSLENVYQSNASSTSLGADTFNSSASNFSYDSTRGILTVYASRGRWMAYGHTEFFGYTVVCRYLGIE